MVNEARPLKQEGADTVMRLLQRNAKVETRYGGGFVQTIDGRAGGTDGGKLLDWFFYVNGVLTDRGGVDWLVGDGDHPGWRRYRLEIEVPRAGSFGATFRVVPRHDDVEDHVQLGHIAWAPSLG